MSNPTSYKRKKEETFHIWLWVGKAILVLVSVILLSTSWKTIQVIYGAQQEYEVKEKVLVESYIDLVQAKNEEKVVTSPEFAARQGREIYRLTNEGERRLQITNDIEVDQAYQTYREYYESQLQEELEKEAQTSGWSEWITVFVP